VLLAAYPGLRVRGFAADYFDVLASPLLTFERRTLAMLMGSNLGNYDPEQAAALMSSLSNALRTGDGVLIGVDGESDRAILELAYNDPTGVTAAFNKNLLARINRELGGDFDLRAFSFFARYDERDGVVRSHLRADRAFTAHVPGVGLDVPFEAGETIHTESSYKFADEDVAKLGTAAGFRLESTWHDRAQRFSVHLLVRT